MSPYDSFTFPEFLPLGLIVRPYGGIKAEPPDVKAEEDLPRRFMFGKRLIQEDRELLVGFLPTFHP